MGHRLCLANWPTPQGAEAGRAPTGWLSPGGLGLSGARVPGASAYPGVCVGGAVLPHCVQVGHPAAEVKGVAARDGDLHGVDVGLLRSGLGGPLGSRELAACRATERREGMGHQECMPLHGGHWSRRKRRCPLLTCSQQVYPLPPQQDSLLLKLEAKMHFLCLC